MNTLSDEQLKELEGLLPLRICIVGDTVDKARHQMIHAFPNLLSTIQSLRDRVTKPTDFYPSLTQAVMTAKDEALAKLRAELDEAMEKGAKWDMHERKKCEYCGSSEHLHTASMPCPGCGAPQCCTICCKMENLKRERDSLRAQVQQWKAAHEADKSVNASLRTELAAAKAELDNRDHTISCLRTVVKSWKENTTFADKGWEDAANERNALQAELAAAKERERGLGEALIRFSRIKESWPLWGIIESLCDATKHSFDHYDMRPDGWETWSVNERLARELCAVMKVEIPMALSQPPQSPQTNCTCDAFKIAQCKGTDNEMYGSLISFWSGEYHTGCDVPTIQFCPWCGKKPQPPTKGEES
jgi:hypothetical protein